MKIFAMCLISVSILMTLISYFTLGPAAHSIKPKAIKLVTNGIYSKIRHPIYMFSLFTWIGFGLLLGSPGLMAFTLIILGIQKFRAQKEEEIMEKEFGEEYRQYKKGTWF